MQCRQEDCHDLPDSGRRVGVSANSVTVVTHLLVADDRPCRREDGPAVDALTLIDDTCAAGVVFCPSCARAVLASFVELAQSRCVPDPLLDAIYALTTTPPDDEAVVLRLMEPVWTVLADYVGGAAHD